MSLLEDTPDTSSTLSMWGGVIDTLLHLEGGKQKLQDDPALKSLVEKLHRIEETKTVDDAIRTVKSAPFSEYEQKWPSSPLLNQLINVSKYERQPFLQAAVMGYLEAAIFLLDRGVDPHTHSEKALRYASGAGHLSIVRLLLDRGANVNTLNDHALRWACENGHRDVVELLLDRGANIHASDDASIKDASYKGHLTTVQLLIERGALNTNVSWVLRLVCATQHHEVLKVLLDFQRDRQIPVNIHALLLEAVEGDHSKGAHINTVKVLLEYGARNGDALVSASDSGHTKIVQLLLQYGIRGLRGEALRWAVQNQHLGIVQLLLEDREDHEDNNDTPLDRFFPTAVNHGGCDVMQLLLNYGADVHFNNDEALYMASENGNIDMVQLLLKYGADVHACEDRALRVACDNSDPGIAKLLLEHGADVHAKDDAAILIASETEDSDLLELLLKYGANVNARTSKAFSSKE